MLQAQSAVNYRQGRPITVLHAASPPIWSMHRGTTLGQPALRTPRIHVPDHKHDIPTYTISDASRRDLTMKYSAAMPIPTGTNRLLTKSMIPDVQFMCCIPRAMRVKPPSVLLTCSRKLSKFARFFAIIFVSSSCDFSYRWQSSSVLRLLGMLLRLAAVAATREESSWSSAFALSQLVATPSICSRTKSASV